MLSIEKLRKPLTLRQGVDRVVEILQSLGFDTTGWQDGRIQKTLVLLHGTLVADFTEVHKMAVEFGSNELGTGVPLTRYSRSRYQNFRQPAVRTRGPMRLSSTASVPYAIQPGQLLASDDLGTQFRNLTGGTLPAGSVASPSSLVLDFEARLAGAAGNVAANSVRRLLTPIAGVVIANNEQAPWYTTVGRDEESDESLRARNRTKWARLLTEFIDETYENIARDLTARKVKIVGGNPRGAGTLDVYVAPDQGLFSTQELADMQAEFAKRVFYTDSAYPPAPLSRVYVRSPTPQPLDIAGTIYRDPNFPEATLAIAVQIALIDFLTRTPIGGWQYASGANHVVLAEDLVDAIKDVEGVRAVRLTTPSAPVSVGTLNIVTQGTWNFAYQVAT